MERPAITCFKEVLKACPLSVEAAQTLMMLGVKPKEIQAITSELTSSECSIPYMTGYLWCQSTGMYFRPCVRPGLVRPVGVRLLCLQQQRLRLGNCSILTDAA